jgi:hypothetical protein
VMAMVMVMVVMFMVITRIILTTHDHAQVQLGPRQSKPGRRGAAFDCEDP